jgi:hypothetical protein
MEGFITTKGAELHLHSNCRSEVMPYPFKIASNESLSRAKLLDYFVTQKLLINHRAFLGRLEDP